MSRWFRTVPFNAEHIAVRTERWEYRIGPEDARVFDVEVRIGKALDVVALKGSRLEDVREYGEFLATSARHLYGESSALERSAACPICREPLTKATTELCVFGVPYVRCPGCAHVLVRHQPAATARARLFAESDQHAAVYVDRSALRVRMEQIVTPKLDWCLAVYSRGGGHAPARIVDVGAGGGHFLAGAVERRLKVEGFEQSRASRAFAKEVFGLELRSDDFLTAAIEPADILTFWGLLEYVQQPREFLAAARNVLAPHGLLIVEVPRVDALGTWVQAQEGAVIARHMDPTSHVHAFSDESLCTALVEEGFAPVAAWYFGMDAFEFAVQAALRAGEDSLLGKLIDWIPPLQRAADYGRQCDDIVVAARAL